ncbi:MAG TPA: UdgX family uracil-DNA binding protein [Actinomycetota bacterium]|nr:UdgX family uracil-DNA binding protein [Actinomycetota bacterium]
MGSAPADLIPPRPTIAGLREVAAACRACELWRRGTRTVFGEGPAPAAVMLLGEQPGDREDRVGRPFVGPAGKLLDRLLDASGIDRRTAYLTNVVKHFNWEPRGKRRIHRRPTKVHVAACRPWLEAELVVVRPTIVVCLGATAAAALLGRPVRLAEERGKVFAGPIEPPVLLTAHPSSILRIDDDRARREAFDALVRDLRVAARRIAAGHV